LIATNKLMDMKISSMIDNLRFYKYKSGVK